MSDPALKSVDEALKSIQDLAAQPEGKPSAKPKRPFGFKRLIFGGVKIIGFTLLPFILLIRLAVYFDQNVGLNAWVGLGLGALLTALLLAGYAGYLLHRMNAKVHVGRVLKGGLLLVLLYCGYAVLFISSANVKSPAVQDTYTALHPALRMAVSTLILVDGGLVVTDAARTPDDYAKMGLPALENSLHYRQTDGYVHAVDLRTRGRSNLRNALTTFYFRAMGFKTLRHVGTADHLHISMAR